MDTPPVIQPPEPAPDQPVPPMPPVTVQIPPSPPPPKNYSVILIVILVILLGILVGMELDETAFISNVRLYLGAKPTPTPTLLPTPSPTPDPTADWKTCTNTTLGFSIKYPTNFDVDPTNCNYAISDYSLVENINVVTPYDDFQKNWLFNITSEKSELDVNPWIESKQLCPNTLCSEITTGPIVNSSVFDIKSHYVETDVVTKIGGTIFKFTLNARNPGIAASLNIKNIMNQILSTFKFLDQNNQGSLTGQHINCPATRSQTQMCPLMCAKPPPYLCGSDGQSYCSACHACRNAGVSWYVMQDTPCEK
jgi:hypothetical protein